MDFAGYRYYRINRILLSVVKLWPYDNSWFETVQRCLFALLLTSGLIVQLTPIATPSLRRKVFLKNLPYIIFTLLFIIKYDTFCFSAQKIKELFDRIQYDWNKLNDEEELKIIRRYSNHGRLCTILLAVFIYPSVIIVIFTPLLPSVLNIVAPLNVSRICTVPTTVDYFFDQRKYLPFILLHIDIVAAIGSTTLIATTATVIVFMQHSCGMYKIVRFIEYMQSTFTISYFFLLLIGVAAVSFNLYRLSQALLMFNDIEELSTVTILIFAQYGYVFINNYAGQELINHSHEVFHKSYDSKWYTAPLPAQKLLLYIMQRSMKASVFLIGGIYVPCFEGFSKTCNVSFSYFMALHTIQT